MSGEPYLASEDSALLRGALTAYSGDSCLEIGAGNGGNLLELAKRFRTVVGTDLVRPSMTDWRRDTNFVLADGAACLRSSCFDLVAFNPPYLEGDETGDVAVEGGRPLEVPKAFLSEAFRTVNRSGKVVFLVNDGTDVEELRGACEEAGFTLRLLASRRLFFEVLSVYEAVKRSEG
ncbi:MAG: hypothetical protein JRN11_03870 [Nitrososphaerota archaeon]|nr:hypothetical protein [Nitrososphaerota archaeon]MDG7013599.1 hypothetical protein [Nitrososphaerota archaeon]MDG7025869.1 hypothetical protein [Nitrososphaerota archaeon]